MKAEVGWLRGWGLWGQSSHSGPEGPKLAPSTGSRLCKALDSYWKGGLILLVEELHFVACGSERARVRRFHYQLFQHP